jgi:hypothetical protein
MNGGDRESGVNREHCAEHISEHDYLPRRSRRRGKLLSHGRIQVLSSNGHIVLILMYRQESFRDTRNTYPAKSKPAVPSTFRTTGMSLSNSYLTLESTRRAASATASAVSPKFWYSAWQGAEAPKRSSPTIFPSSPT